MFGVPGTLGAKIRDLGLGGWGAHVCYSLPGKFEYCFGGELWGFPAALASFLVLASHERVCFDVVGEQQEKKGSGMHSQILGKWAPDPPTPKSRNLVPNRPGTPFFKFLVSVS